MKTFMKIAKIDSTPYTGTELSPMKCICCGTDIHLLDNADHPGAEPNSLMWDGGVLEKVTAGYGSGHDGDVFYIAICDKCISQKISNGSVIFVYNYMSNYKTKERRKELNKVLHRRNKLRRIIK